MGSFFPIFFRVAPRLLARHGFEADFVDDQQRVLRQIIKQRFQIVLKEAQPMFDTGVFAARADSFVQRIIGTRRTKFDAVILAEPGDRGLVHDHLGHRGEFHLGQFFGRAVGRRIEAARAAGKPTVPSTLTEEKRTNPFLRADVPEFKAALGMNDASDLDVFTFARAQKDKF